jgi:SAM-dependent methyltransferase
MNDHNCRACHGKSGRLVLDLGEQPACDYFPKWDDPGPDPVYPLQMWLCSSCGLAQLLTDPTLPEEPRGTEPAALVAQAADAVGRVSAAGLLPAGARVSEYGSPHGGSWLGLLADRGLTPVDDQAQADVVLDCFGLMHAPDQAAALAERAARVAPGGVLLLQYHALDAIVTHRQWNALRHGHYAYYSTTALTAMLAAIGFSPRTAWHFDLYGGTVLLAAGRDPVSADTVFPDTVFPDTVFPDTVFPDTVSGDSMVRELLAVDVSVGVLDPATILNRLQRNVRAHADALHDWLLAERSAGRLVLGYGAASRAVALLRTAGIDHELLPAVADASPAKQGLRMPGTRIPVIAPAELAAQRPASVLVFVSDLLAEVRTAWPQIEESGGRWVAADALATQ